ncbi:LamG domain-containing protein [Leptolyngbya cf. ectocarpi LEGE 11479]|uniref:LamG domain-containing protein n=1 Tax=Leptolyngbya cf. ectocarpi LEGE 11479 TaxID=1828722 RepID=A0A929F532_LEPEC|nr:LamG domain-containing protein [Leptolyngbya ectocarpi]MBE9067370.1 LamG domain-containing protein [Leptolyngbya cf. ectocarpi LEGE 11479]
MTVQPNYHWQFEEKQGTVTADTVSGVKVKLSNTTWLGHGRIGNAIKIDGRTKNSRIVFDQDVARFGTSDFTVAFGMKAQGTYGQKALHVIGNRSTSGHGNFFSIRMKQQGQLTFEVDENTRGKNYAFLNSKRPLKDSKWHHIAAVRQGRSLKLYIDGELSDEGTSKTGIANIITDTVLFLGARGLKTPIAQYEDLRIYHTALNAEDIRALVPPVNRPLNEGEIELVATDNAAVILTQNDTNLSRFSSSFKKLRIGNNTGVTLYQENSFGGTAQKCYADLPDIRLSRLENFPKSIRIWPAIEEPFTGKWVIKAPNGQFLSLGKSVLTTAPRRSFNELFRFHYNLQRTQLQLIPGSDQESTLLKILPGKDFTHLFVDDLEHLKDEFSIINQANNQWLALVEDNTFDWTGQKEDRAVFIRVAKMADNEGQVGELASGEVALYKHRAYYGRTWILSNSDKDRSGNYTHLTDFQDLNDQTSSIRLGPDTGVTLFKNLDHQAVNSKREEEIEDIVENVPRLSDRQIGNDTISSIQIFRTISPEDVFTSYTTKLSQDYRMVGNDLEEFSAYRTTLRFEPGAGAIDVSATDLTNVEVEGTTHEIDEARSVTLSPNELNLIMITSEADGLNTPGLKIRTSEMALNERVVIFPNKDAHQQLAELEDGALWNATDAQGNLIVDRQAHSKEEVASVQNTVKRVMATVNYAEDAPIVRRGSDRIQSSNRAVSGATIDKPWELKLKPASSQLLSARAANDSQRFSASTATTLIQESEISQDEFTRLLSQAAKKQKPVKLPPGRGLIRIGKPLKKIKKAVKKAASVVVGTVKDVVHVIVKTAEGVIDFVVDTAEKVADFVEAVVEKVVNGIKKFIEYLQFLFNWGDILATQRYLVRVFNSGLNSATQLAEKAKPRVSAFVDGLQDTVEDGMNTLVEELGSEPSDVRESGFELPEAFEWFLSKLLDGSKQGGANTALDTGANANGDSALENFFSHFLETLEDLVGAGLRGAEGLIESIQALIQNPRQPQLALVAIIEALRDVIIQSLEAAENLALGILDIVGEVIKQFKKLLNTEIKIPFISDLFKLIGAGKLTLLNLSSVLLAIPVTVISKIVTNEKPFTKGALPLELSNQTTVKLAAASETEANEHETDLNSLRTDIALTMIAATADTANHVINGILDLTDKPRSESSDASSSNSKELPSFSKVVEIASLFLSGVSLAVSYPYESADDAKEAKREKILWGVRATALGVDLAGCLAKGQRMRRLNTATTIGWSVYSLVDMILFSMYLAAVEEDNKAIKNADIMAEVFSWLPNVSCIAREIPLPEPYATLVHVGHAATNGVAAVSSLATGIVLVRQGDKALQDAKAAA